MLRNSILSLATASLFVAAAAAQNCSDNLFPVQLVTQQGAAIPRVADSGIGHFAATSENVYLAFPATIPSGTYYVFVTNQPTDGQYEFLSTNDPMERFVSVQNDAGVISLSLPFATNPSADQFGVGLGGQGMSLRLSPFSASVNTPCRFKVTFGDTWDLTYGYNHPFLLIGGIQPNGNCPVRSYDAFWVGDGDGSDVTGTVFVDSDRDGVRDAGEGGFANQEVRLVTGATSVSTTTDAAGAFRFANVAAGSYTVEYTLPSTHVGTTAASFAVEVCSCADVAVSAFGAAPQVLPCHARPVDFWCNQTGMGHVHNRCLLPTLPCLQIVNHFGCRVAFGNFNQLRSHLQCSTTWNMANALSAQLIAMHCNIGSGFVHPDCVVVDPQVGTTTIGQLVQQAVCSLIAHPNTLPGNFYRQQQERLKNALERANCNRTWR